jgi:adenylosuccinate lyase
VTAVIAPDRLAELFDPVRYTGEAAAFADRVLAAHRQSKA